MIKLKSFAVILLVTAAENVTRGPRAPGADFESFAKMVLIIDGDVCDVQDYRSLSRHRTIFFHAFFILMAIYSLF